LDGRQEPVRKTAKRSKDSANAKNISSVISMRYIYLDNIRGFSNTIIPILNVNFLVGENSTGKTSVLMMLRMINNRSLFFGTHAFVGAEQQWETLYFGHFNEMVSAHSTDRTYFRIGVVFEMSGKKKTSPILGGIFVTFREDNGLPSISQFTYATGGEEISVRIEDDHQFHFKKLLHKAPPSEKEMRKQLRLWATQHADPIDEAWTTVKLSPPARVRQLPPFILITLINNRSKESPSSGGGSRNADEQIADLSFPMFGPDLVWVAPIRAKPSRTYDDPLAPFSPEGGHAPYLIRRMLDSPEEERKFRQFVDRVGKASGLFEKIDIKYFARDKTGPFEVDAFIDGEGLSLGWLGYGVSQSLPILVELIFRERGSWFAIQQPEVHLHPRAQAALGDAFFEMAALDSKTFLIETHSDFTIDRFRMNYRSRRSAKARATLPTSQVLFFERRDKHNTVTPISIDQNGNMDSDQPDSYRNFFIKEEMRLIGPR
jgi:AAA domain, putative AbiEii toxin, Type IV TA system